MDSDNDSDNSSVTSASPQASPSNSIHALPSVERLVQHLASAKRALSSTEYIWRANELVTSSRALLEEIAVLNARNTFAQRGVNEQLDILNNVKDSVVTAGQDAADAFRGTIESLDLANDRLERTLNALKKTSVDASLQRSAKDATIDLESAGRANGLEAGTADDKSLFNFINETNHGDLQASLRTLIDSFYDSQGDLNDTINKFDNSLRTISSTLPSHAKVDRSPDIGTIYDEPPLSIPQLFRGMEDHSAEMATLLQSLISHYDLCVTALKHTEGGSEAAKRAVQQANESSAKETTNGTDESLFLKNIPEPISEEERNEMLRVLENDAQEVDDVVGEVKERNRDQENLYEQLNDHVNKARLADTSLRQVLDLLHEMKDIHLPSHMHALTSFKASWQRIQASIESQTAELAALSSFYDGFLSGYAKLLDEIDRQREAERQMRKVAEKARKDLSRLYNADRGMREEFMKETGKFLPHGIWDGLADEGTRWEIEEKRPDR